MEGEIVDSADGKPLPVRLYIRGSDGTWHFPKSASSQGSAIRYERRNWINTNVVEMHTTLSAHPFRIELLPGRYTFTVEHGKEYFPEVREVIVERGMAKSVFKLRRWVNMAERGWYSGDAHNHRDPADLPNVMLAENVNVGLPMTDWTTTSTAAPSASGRGLEVGTAVSPVRIDDTHVWHPRNTEYEIFQTGNSNHTLGALLIVNHRTRFDQLVFPLRAVAEKARSEGALLDLDKHNWPWSLALVPLLNIDLYELANNHHWETEYAIKNWAVPAPAWMGLTGSGSATERDWTLYTFQTYYTLLNCGFRLRPSAGTANGVHPVPLGFGRVYVHLDEPFSFDAWMRGLGAGRSFVTTGPMIFARVDGQWPGARFQGIAATNSHHLTCTILSERPLESIELIMNGESRVQYGPENRQTSTGAYQTEITTQFSPISTSWLAWRCFESRPNGRFRFAHTGPWYFDVPGQPLRPRKVETDWLAARVREEIARSQSIAPQSLVDDYQQALKIYEQLGETAR
jgi:hypothetical protein